jgi:hypothetical protein
MYIFLKASLPCTCLGSPQSPSRSPQTRFGAFRFASTLPRLGRSGTFRPHSQPPDSHSHSSARLCSCCNSRTYFLILLRLINICMAEARCSMIAFNRGRFPIVVALSQCFSVDGNQPHDAWQYHDPPCQ